MCVGGGGTASLKAHTHCQTTAPDLLYSPTPIVLLAIDYRPLYRTFSLKDYVQNEPTFLPSNLHSAHHSFTK